MAIETYWVFVGMFNLHGFMLLSKQAFYFWKGYEDPQKVILILK
jgi:hypothetical protein